MNKYIVSFCLLAVTALPMSAQVDKTIEKIKEKGTKIYERSKDYVEDKADKIIDRYGLDTIDVKKVDEQMAKRYMKKGSYDEDYLERPTQRFTAKVRSNFSGSGADMNGHWNGSELNSRLSSSMRFTTNVGFSYRGIGISLSANPFKWKGNKRNTELGFNISNNKYGIDLSYQNAKNNSGWMESNGVRTDIGSSLVTTKMFMANAYYAFNNRRFSYPAAFTQSYRQLRSQGSWLLGASLMAGNVRVSRDVALDNPSFRMSMASIGLGGGYGYNWVISPQWMVHASAIPTFVVGSTSHMTVNGERERLPFAFPEFIVTGRTAVLYELTEAHFFGLSFVTHNTLLVARNKPHLDYYKWRLTLCYGFRF